MGVAVVQAIDAKADGGETQGSQAAGRPFWSAGYRAYALTLLMLIYTVNFVDRQIVNILAEPIKHEFGLADWQVGLMGGFAFALFYVTLGLPIARFAERANRSLIIAAAVAVWSGCTALCGFATSYGQLLMARVGVGIGEAGCSPPAHSLISDSVPKERRASSLAFYQLGNPLGALLGLAIGGLIASAFGWRAAFLIVGLPGLAFAALAALTLRDPRKARAAAAVAAAEAPVPTPSFRETLRVLRGKKSYWLVCFASGVKAIVGYGQGVFIASFFLRNHGEALQAMAERFGLQGIGVLGVAIGVTSGVGGLIGTYAGGLITDRLARRSARGYVVAPAVGALLVVPLTMAMVLAPTLEAALAIFSLQALFAAVWPGPVYAICQGVVRPDMRATSSAIQLFIGNLTGLCIGPLAVGILSDVFAGLFGLGAAEGIRWALFSCSLVGLLAFALFWRARRYLDADMES